MKFPTAWPESLQIVLFLGFYGLFHSLYFGLPDNVLRDVIHYYGIGLLCSSLIHFIAPLEQVSAVHNHLQSPLADLVIVRGCDGAGVLFLVMAAILAFPASLKQKLIGLLLGVAFMYTLNLVRIIGLYFVVAYHNDWFLLVHTYLAPTLFIIVACLFFAWWALGSVRENHEPR